MVKGRKVKSLRIRNILVPMDFSGMSRQALHRAVPLARSHGARIHLVHVQAPDLIISSPYGIVASNVRNDSTDYYVSALKLSRARLRDLLIELVPVELRGKTFVRQGNPAVEVVAAAQKLKVGLIVLSTTGRSGLGRVVLGSTAERIVRYAHCSVMTIRRRAAAPSSRAGKKSKYANALKLRNVLVPIDLSTRSLGALQTAVALLGAGNARLFLLYVVDVSPTAFAPEGLVAPVPPYQAMVAAAKQDLARVAGEYVPKIMRRGEFVVRGSAAESIVRVARAKHADLIVLSTHGRTGIRRWFMGSTAESVVRQAQCPVLVAR